MIISNKDIKLEKLDEKSCRKVLSYGDSLMMVEVHFKKGGIGELHSHDRYEQVSYIVKGSFEVKVGNKKTILKAGDSFCVRKNVEHGVVAKEDSIIVDVFTPIRDDFLI